MRAIVHSRPYRKAQPTASLSKGRKPSASARIFAFKYGCWGHIHDCSTGGSKQTSISTACFQLPSNPDRPAKSRKPPTFQKVGSRVPRLAFPPLNTVAVYSHLFDGGSKQTSISIACFQLPSNPDRPAKSRQLPTFPKVGICRAPRVLCFIEFQPSFNPDRPTKPSQPQTFQKVGIVSGDPPLSASSTSYASTCRFR